MAVEARLEMQERRPLRGRAASQFVVRFPLATIGALIVGLFVLLGIFAPWLTPVDPNAQDVPNALTGPSWDAPLGRDDLGRDVLSRVILGARASLQVGVISVAIAVALGVPLGLAAGYIGGVLDDIIMRIMDALFAFPTLILAIAIIAALGPSLFNAMLAIGIASMPSKARLVRGEVLSIRSREFVVAARLSGATNFRIVAKHVFPNTLSILAIATALSIAGAILTEASLSFLGLGVLPPTPSWGSMLRFGTPFMERAPWLSIAPGVLITITVLGFSLLGDGIRDFMDPRLRRR